VTDEEKPAVLRNAWTLRPYERVVRRFHVTGDRRGMHTLGPVELSIGDPFARRAAIEERDEVDTFLVWPRTIATTELAPIDRWGDLDRARRGLVEDPSRFAGVRPYAPGDPVRRVHARTSARLDHPMLKRFEPSRDREVLVARAGGRARLRRRTAPRPRRRSGRGPTPARPTSGHRGRRAPPGRATARTA